MKQKQIKKKAIIQSIDRGVAKKKRNNELVTNGNQINYSLSYHCEEFSFSHSIVLEERPITPILN